MGSAALSGASALAQAATDAPARNVILIIADTLRRDALGCYGSTWVRTPYLDRFAAKAVVLEQAFVSSFPTVPCRNDVLTGRYTFTYKPWSPLDADAVTLQETIAKAGIRTALIADTRHPFTEQFNYQRGFGFTRLFRGQEGDPWKKEPASPKLPCAVNKLRSGPRVVTNYLRNVHDRKGEEDYFVAQTMRTAAQWLKERAAEGRFFLYVDTFDPHEPWDPPRRYVDMYDPGYSGEEVIYPRYDLWKEFLTEAELKHCRALYAGEVSLVDQWIGHLLETIENLDLLSNTLVIITTDHGFFFGEHGFVGKLWIRDQRRQSLPLYPEVSRIPMLISYPHGQAGARIRGLAQPVNLMPTILESLGVAVPPSVQSRSLAPMLWGQGDRFLVTVAVSSPTLSYAGLRSPEPTDRSSITDGRWMLIYGAQGREQPAAVPATAGPVDQAGAAPMGGQPVPELYDLDSDPRCALNVYLSHLDIARSLHAEYVALLTKSGMKENHLAFFRKLPGS